MTVEKANSIVEHFCADRSYCSIMVGERKIINWIIFNVEDSTGEAARHSAERSLAYAREWSMEKYPSAEWILGRYTQKDGLTFWGITVYSTGDSGMAKNLLLD